MIGYIARILRVDTSRAECLPGVRAVINGLDAPAVEPIIVESSDPLGPFGAKEAAEAVGVAIVPAIANAIFDATGTSPRSLPITSESILKGLGAT